MERIKSLKFENKQYTEPVIINNLLLKNGFNWLNLAEIENAILEIKKDKIYWHSGIWYYGDWKYGIWLDGVFKYGNWYDGVWKNGVFKNGTWHNGIWMNGVFEDGTFKDGEFRDGVKKGGNFENELKEIKEIKGNLEVLKFVEYNKK